MTTIKIEGHTVRLLPGRYGMHILISSLISVLRNDQVTFLKTLCGENEKGIKTISNYIDNLIGRLSELERLEK